MSNSSLSTIGLSSLIPQKSTLPAKTLLTKKSSPNPSKDFISQNFKILTARPSIPKLETNQMENHQATQVLKMLIIIITTMQILKLSETTNTNKYRHISREIKFKNLLRFIKHIRRTRSQIRIQEVIN